MELKISIIKFWLVCCLDIREPGSQDGAPFMELSVSFLGWWFPRDWPVTIAAFLDRTQ